VTMSRPPSIRARVLIALTDQPIGNPQLADQAAVTGRRGEIVKLAYDVLEGEGLADAWVAGIPSGGAGQPVDDGPSMPSIYRRPPLPRPPAAGGVSGGVNPCQFEKACLINSGWRRGRHSNLW
jgi:hypothetical protein